MDEDWRNAFEILICTELWDGAGAGICHGASSTCSSVDIGFYSIALQGCIDFIESLQKDILL